MAKQTVTLRLDEDDLTYLARTEVPGAGNLSEKIRALLAQARAQQEGLRDDGAAYAFARQLLDAPDRSIRQAEIQTRTRSELVARTLAWLPDAIAYVLAGAGQFDRDGHDSDQRQHTLRDFEAGLGERVLALTDSVLQLARAGFPGCYSPQSLATRAQSTLGLAARAATASDSEPRS